MKTLHQFHHLLVLLIMASGIFIVQSCVVYSEAREPSVKVPDIIKMSKDGLTSKDIIQKIKQSHTVYGLKADQLAKLQKQGVSDSVINYMEETRINSIIRDNEWNGTYNWWPGWGGYYYGYPYYGYPYYGRPYNDWGYGGYWRPSIIFRHGGHSENRGPINRR